MCLYVVKYQRLSVQKHLLHSHTFVTICWMKFKLQGVLLNSQKYSLMTSSAQCFCQEHCCQSVYCSFMSAHTCFHKASTRRGLWGCPGIKPGSTDSATSSGAALSFHKGADSSLSQSSSEEGKKQSINKKFLLHTLPQFNES